MKVLIKKAKILNSPSPYHNQVKDLLLVNGEIKEIADFIDSEADQVIEGQALIISAGFLDLSTFSKDPGEEFMESLASLSLAAAKGGFTEVLIMPNTKPVTQTKSAVNYFRNFSTHSLTALLPAAAVTVDTKGESFTEMWDLWEAGAYAFTDGKNPLWNADIFYKTLQYLNPKKALLINRPEEQSLALFGQMHEGITSTRMGTKGIPSEAEELMVMRDLKLLEYADLKSEKPVLHFSCISAAASVRRIRKAKQNGLPVSCDVAAHQLVFSDEDLSDFNTNLKVLPPFRSKKDLKSLQKGLEDGTIDAIVSDHNPLDEEHKNLEFDLADFGVIGLQTAFAAAWTYGNQKIETLIKCFSENPRHLLNLQIPIIETNQKANICVLDTENTFTFTQADIVSKSKNSPFIGKKLKGKILASFNNGKSQING